jgi:hypothetical protein
MCLDDRRAKHADLRFGVAYVLLEHPCKDPKQHYISNVALDWGYYFPGSNYVRIALTIIQQRATMPRV